MSKTTSAIIGLVALVFAFLILLIPSRGDLGFALVFWTAFGVAIAAFSYAFSRERGKAPPEAENNAKRD